MQATVGTVQRQQPILVTAASGMVAADLTIDGGLGHNPLTISGLKRHDGWQLQQLVKGKWLKVDQAVHGGDYWQANHDPVAGTWSLTYSLPNRGKQRYRLRFVGT